jgi:Mn2+/Fe2+ NRAMP family transporter
MMSLDETPESQHHANRPRKTLLRLLGPGVVAGAADDDPSGIATYSQAGAQFGFGQLWSVALTLPFMVAIQLVAARIGRASGIGIVANTRKVAAPAVVVGLVALVLFANIVNIAADLAAMGAALQLVIGGPVKLYAVGFGLFCLGLEIIMPYRRYAAVLKWLTLALLAYVGTVLSVHVPWGEVLSATFLPKIAFDTPYLLTVVAVFGTTISPYVFLWQAGQEVEELRLARARPLSAQEHDRGGHLNRITIDTSVGMVFSNVVAFCIMLTTAVTLHGHGTTDIGTAAEAAEALRPVAGELTFALFALGIIGTGLLAVPVLAGSAAYAVAEAFQWRSSLEMKPLRARNFYAIIAAATAGGAVIDLTGLDPIKMLFWAAVINGFAAVPIMALMMWLARDARVMGRWVLPGWLVIAGWAATALMALAVGILVWSSLG